MNGHTFGQFSLLFLTPLVVILKMHIGIKSISGTLGIIFGNPYHIPSCRLTTNSTISTWTLIPSVSVGAYPIKSVQVSHDWNHCPIILHIRHHLNVKPLVKGTMGIYF